MVLDSPKESLILSLSGCTGPQLLWPWFWKKGSAPDLSEAGGERRAKPYQRGGSQRRHQRGERSDALDRLLGESRLPNFPICQAPIAYPCARVVGAKLSTSQFI